MYVFGGKSSTLPDSSACKSYTKLYLNDLWALDTSSYHWTQIRATGITPSPDADMGQSLHSPERKPVLLRNLSLHRVVHEMSRLKLVLVPWIARCLSAISLRPEGTHEHDK